MILNQKLLNKKNMNMNKISNYSLDNRGQWRIQNLGGKFSRNVHIMTMEIHQNIIAVGGARASCESAPGCI